MITIDGFMEKMLCFFPYKLEDYNESIQENFGRLNTVIIEDIFMPEIITVLEEDNEIEKLQQIFSYFESVSREADEELRNIFSITILEMLGNKKDILDVAKKYMNLETVRLQHEADCNLGRIIE